MSSRGKRRTSSCSLCSRLLVLSAHPPSTSGLHPDAVTLLVSCEEAALGQGRPTGRVSFLHRCRDCRARLTLLPACPAFWWFPVTGGLVSLQEEKDKVQAQKEEVLSHMNDVLENELQCIICSEYFIELSTSGGSPTSPHSHPHPHPPQCTSL